MTKQLEHFVRLANRGQSGGGSGGERRAWEIARVLLEHTPGLDEDATKAIGELAELISEKPWMNWEDVRETVLNAEHQPPTPGLD